MVVHRWVIDWQYVATPSVTEVVLPVGKWERVNPGAKFGRGWGELRGKFQSPSIGFGYEVANDVDIPDGSTRVSTLVAANGVFNPSGTPTSVDLDGVKYIRPVIFAKSATDATLAGGMVSGVVELWSNS